MVGADQYLIFPVRRRLGKSVTVCNFRRLMNVVSFLFRQPGNLIRYNTHMRLNLALRGLLLFSFLLALFNPPSSLLAHLLQFSTAQATEVTAFDLILAMNTLRASYGNRLLVEDPIVMAVAQATAEIMAANQMSNHIGDVRGRIAAAGYGGGGKVWATENFAAGGNYSIDEIMLAWADPDHMLPATNAAYCHVGAGIAKAANGLTYYVLQAAYVSGEACGKYAPPGGDDGGGGAGDNPPPAGISQLIVPVKIAEPDADGKLFHVVESGQSLWAIAIAYKVTVKDLEIWNNISKEWKLQIGQRLFIPGPNTEGYATPTPVGMVQISKADRSGKIIHEVQVYQTLSTISQAYGVSLDQILALNSIQTDSILSIGQRLLIDPGSVTPTATPRPLTAVEKLIPDTDGRYYHTVKSGETISWIANLYEINMFDLMSWNGLNDSSILQPDQKLLLQVTPPATQTPTPAPVTPTLTATSAPPTPTPTPSRTLAAISPTPQDESTPQGGGQSSVWIIPIGLAAAGILVAILVFRKNIVR
jgi:LysM repeat protein